MDVCAHVYDDSLHVDACKCSCVDVCGFMCGDACECMWVHVVGWGGLCGSCVCVHVYACWCMMVHVVVCGIICMSGRYHVLHFFVVMNCMWIHMYGFMVMCVGACG
jgi:hypothetical protein